MKKGDIRWQWADGHCMKCEILDITFKVVPLIRTDFIDKYIVSMTSYVLYEPESDKTCIEYRVDYKDLNTGEIRYMASNNAYTEEQAMNAISTVFYDTEEECVDVQYKIAKRYSNIPEWLREVEAYIRYRKLINILE